MFKGSRVGLFLVGLGISAVANSVVESRFDTDADGWQGVDVALPNLTVNGFGSPVWSGGQISLTEIGTSNGLMVFAAPAKFLGDKSEYYGGTVTYQLGMATNDGVPYPNLLLHGNGTTLFASTAAPGTGLTAFSFNLTPTGWLTGANVAPTEAEFRGVLSALDAFAINADWTTNTVDVATLDNVAMTQAVPEPTTLAVLGLGAAALLRRRKKA